MHPMPSMKPLNKTPNGQPVPGKPSILDIIVETEKNRTRQQNQQNKQKLPPPPPKQKPLPRPEPPIRPRIDLTAAASSDSPKAISIIDPIRGHPGIAEPLTWQQLESEMTSSVDQKLRDSSTSKDGISTWILLSGTDNKSEQSSTPGPTTIVGQIEKLEVKTPERPNYRFEPVNLPKPTKPAKNHRDRDGENKFRPEKKSKPTVSPVTSTTSSILLASDFTTEAKLPIRRKSTTPKVIKRKFTPRTTTTTTTTTTEATSLEKTEDEATIFDLIEETTHIQPARTTTPYPFIVLEPKDADFDLPQDRSPSTKKPKSKLKTKKKNPIKNKITNAVGKPATKLKEKPMTTKIYNYISREVMPTVGVGLMGLVVTAGLASYFLGPFTALRRSYDEALDRQDNLDGIYQVNSEEYAGAGADNGQNEEDVLGKFIAGMPASNVPKFVKYYRQEQQTPYHANPNIQQQPTYMPQRRVYGSKYGPNPTIRYRGEPTQFVRNAPSPHFNAMQYYAQQTQLRNHQSMNQQPSPVYDPRVHDVQKQKSFASNVETLVPQSQMPIASEPAMVTIEEKSKATDIMAEETSTPVEERMVRGEVSDANDVIPQIQRRTNTYIVGSNIRSDEAIVSASMTAASAEDLVHSDPIEPVVTVTAASHGPRRRRRDTMTSTKTDKPENDEPTTLSPVYETTTVQIASSTTSSTPKSRIYNREDFATLEMDFNHLKMKLMNMEATAEQSTEKIKKKLETEFENIETDFSSLKRVVDTVDALEAFQKQLKIRAKNYEISVTIRTGMLQIRQRMRLLNELIDHPNDDRIIEKINRRDGNPMPIPGTNETSTDKPLTNIDEPENGFAGFIKLLQLKAQFGLNVLRTIKPSFERAFEDVFGRPLKEN